LEKVDPTLALPNLVEALWGVQETLIRTATSDVSLAKVLSEVVQTVEACRRKLKKLERAREAKEQAAVSAGGGEVRMQE
jgi:hypothetical protein